MTSYPSYLIPHTKYIIPGHHNTCIRIKIIIQSVHLLNSDQTDNMCLAILLLSLIQCVYVICDNNNTVMNVTSNADFSLENGWEIDAIDSLDAL